MSFGLSVEHLDDARKGIQAVLAYIDAGIEKIVSGVPDEKKLFFTSELRRRAQLYGDPRYLHFALESPGRIASKVRELNTEWDCYFGDISKFQQLSASSFYWKSVFGGSSAEIERSILDAGIVPALKKIGLDVEANPWTFEPKGKIARSELNPRIRRFLVGRGYLYPIDADHYVAHRNLLAACSGVRWFADAPFNRRDSARCPWILQSKIHEADMWKYFCDLTALDFAGIGNYDNMYHFSPEMFYGRVTEDSGGMALFATTILKYKLPKYLEYGRSLVPRRYTELEPTVELFNWNVTPLFQEQLAKSLEFTLEGLAEEHNSALSSAGVSPAVEAGVKMLADDYFNHGHWFVANLDKEPEQLQVRYDKERKMYEYYQKEHGTAVSRFFSDAEFRNQLRQQFTKLQPKLKKRSDIEQWVSEASAGIEEYYTRALSV